MSLWILWVDVVWQLRNAFSRSRSFFWAAVVLAGFSTRCGDTAGVGSVVRVLGLEAAAYGALRRLFHSSAVSLWRLTHLWVVAVFKIFGKRIVTDGKARPVLVADGLKNPKEGRRMPGVKLLHQESSNNSKPEFVMAHSCQCVSLLVEGAPGQHLAVPLAGRIVDGVKFSNRDHRTIFDKLVALLAEVRLLDVARGPFVLVADAYYCCGGLGRALLEVGSHLITRVRSNAVAFVPAPRQEGPRRRGRPRIYGNKLRLWDLFSSMTGTFTEAPSPLYDDGPEVWIRYLSLDLIWRPLGRLVRFVLVEHPTRGRIVFVSTDIELDPLRVIFLYGLRFKIEVAFKTALHDIGAFAYRFWMKAMSPLKRGAATQHLHRESDEYRDRVRLKLRAYELHIQLGLIAQGLLQYLAVTSARQVWAAFRGWLVTMNPHATPSEAVTARALASSLPEFLASTRETSAFEKFLREKLDPRRSPLQNLWRPPKNAAA